MALQLLGKLNNTVAHSKNKLLTALELAIAGNIRDFGVKNNLNVKDELRKILKEEKMNLIHFLLCSQDQFLLTQPKDAF
jgi:uncharacterized protein with ATP-grasp and redox domains